MPELGRAALVAALGLILYAALAGGYAALRGRRRLLESARNAFLPRSRPPRSPPPSSSAVLAGRTSPSTTSRHSSRDLPARYTFTAFWSGQAGSLLLWLLVLTDAGSVAVAAQPPARPRRAAVDGADPGRRRDLLRASARVRREPVRDPARGGRRARAQPEPAEPLHDDSPAAALPRLRRADDSLRLRHGRARLPPGRRALDRRHAPLDARAPGRSSASASSWAPSGPTRRWAGAAGTRGTRSRTPRSCPGSSRRRSCTR